jgi:hypothetical protein
MPDLPPYVLAIASAGLVSSIVSIAIGARASGLTRLKIAAIWGVGAGLTAAAYLLLLSPVWPPPSALDRLLAIIVPAALLIESAALPPAVPTGLVWLLRFALAIATPRVLLHGSVYLSEAGDWTSGEATLMITVAGLLLIGVWVLLAILAERPGGASIPLALCLAIQSAGLAVMMAGYIKGGAAGSALAAALIGAIIGLWLMTRNRDVAIGDVSPSLVAIGVIGLFGLLFVGRYFGRVSTGMALIMLLAPLLCWVTEAPALRNRNRWIVAALRLLLVSAPLVIVLVAAKREFDREMAPLLGELRTISGVANFF